MSFVYSNLSKFNIRLHSANYDDDNNNNNNAKIASKVTKVVITSLEFP